MFVDTYTLLADALSLTSSAAFTSTYDSGAAGNEIGAGEPLSLAIAVDVAADATTGDETYAFSIEESASAAQTSPTTLVSRTISRTLLTAGSLHYIDLPAGAKALRYLGGYYTGGGTTPTITVTSWFCPTSMKDKVKAYPKGYTVQ